MHGRVTPHRRDHPGEFLKSVQNCTDCMFGRQYSCGDRAGAVPRKRCTLFSRTKITFTHRRNQDGTHDSICSDCFATIATVQHERELSFKEAAHICRPIRLYQFGQRSGPLQLDPKNDTTTNNDGPVSLKRSFEGTSQYAGPEELKWPRRGDSTS